MSRNNFGLAACAAAVLLGWAGLAGAQQRVVLYTSNEATLNKLIAGEFEKATGIAVDVISAGSGVVIKRLQSEKDRPQGDLVWGISRSLLQTNAQYFDSYASEHKNAIPAEFRDPQDRWIGTNLHLLVVLQNTKSIPEAQGPKTWEDLTTPRFKGNIAFTDPANSGSAYSNVTMLVDLWGGGNAGWSKVERLFANTRVLNRSALVFQGVGNGEYGLGISLEYAGYLWANNGAPVKVVYPADGTIAQMEGVAVIKAGPNTGGRASRRLREPQGRARDDPQADLPPPGAPGPRPRQPAGQDARALAAQAPQVRRGGLDGQARRDDGSHQGDDPEDPLVGRDRHRGGGAHLRHGARHRRRFARRARRRVLHAVGPVGLRQDHAAPHGRGLLRPGPRPDPVRRAAHRPAAAAPAQRRHGVPELRDLSQYTVGGNVAYGLTARNVAPADIERRVTRALKLVHLDGYEERWPHQLSGGQLQRVAIARALVIEPEVLLLDEPLSNLDAKLRVEMRAEIRQLQQQLKITAIYVTHDQEEALAISDRIAVMQSGRLEPVGAPESIYRTPASAFVAEFMGTTNLLTGRWRDATASGCASASALRSSPPAAPTPRPAPRSRFPCGRRCCA